MYFIDNRIVKIFIGLFCFFVGAMVGDILEKMGHSKMETLSYGIAFLGAFMTVFILIDYLKEKGKK